MNATDYRTAIGKLGMSQRGTAKFFETTPTSGQRWAKDGPPPIVALWLRFMLTIQANVHIEDVPAWINLMIGRKMETGDKRKRRKISP